MKTFCAILNIFISTLSCEALAVVLYDQSIPYWDAAVCSTCEGDLDSFYTRTFGSFALPQHSVLQRGTFAVRDLGPASDDLHISVWDSPTGTELYSLVAAGGSYTKVPNPDLENYYAVVDLPNWQLTAGSYWISLFGTNGNFLGWGANLAGGDDRQYQFNGSLILNSDEIYVEFKLEGTVPEPGSFALAVLSTAAVGFTRRRVRSVL